jgi:hypothetical protein
MARLPIPFDTSATELQITPWHDPVLDAVGHDLRSAYVERFWLPILGPSTLLLARRIAAGFEVHPGGFALGLEETAAAMGLSLRDGANGPFYRAVARTVQFHITRPAGPAALTARPRVQQLSHRQLARLPVGLQRDHAAWIAEDRAEPTEEQRRQRARRLALSLLELGETREAAEHQLHRWKFHPAIAHDALRWAEVRLAGRTQLTAADAQPGQGSTVTTPGDDEVTLPAASVATTR